MAKVKLMQAPPDDPIFRSGPQIFVPVSRPPPGFRPKDKPKAKSPPPVDSTEPDDES